MSILRTRTIRQKLITIIMATCIISLLSAGLAFIGWQWASLRNRMVQNLSIHAAMIGDNCKAALAFEDTEAAEETLGALRAQDSIIYGCIRTTKREVFADYHRDKSDGSVHLFVQRQQGYYFGNKSLTVLMPITLDKEEIGMVCLLSDLQPLYTALKHNIYTIIIVISVVCLIAYLISTKLQRVISGPILNLAEVARDVSEKREYSARAVKQSDDEVGLLIEAFNEMLEQIQQRDSELVGSKEQLEIKVKERTKELSSSNVKLAEEVAERSSTQRKLRERIKEIGCLYETSKLFEQPEISLEQIFQKTTEMLRNAYRHPELTTVKITFDGIPYKTDNFETSEIRQFAELWIKGENVGSIDVYYLGERPEGRQSPFLKEEKQLLDTVAGNLARMAERKKAEKALKESELKFKAIFENAGGAIFIADIETGKILDCNSQAEQMLGRTRDEIIGMHQSELHPEGESEKYKEIFTKCIQKGHTVEYEGEVQRKDGRRIPIWINSQTMEIAGKDVIAELFMDITERKQAEERFRILFESSQDAIMTLAPPDWKFTSGNPATVKLFGVKTESEFSSLGPWDLSPEYQPDGQLSSAKAKEMIETAMKEASNYFEWTHKRLNGEEFPATVLLTRMEFEGKALLQATVRDITESKQAEERQAKLLEQLEGVNEELESFAYVVSHDLKAPLRGIKTLADWISSDYADKFDDDGKEKMKLLSGRADRMHNLIDGILRYSRIGRVEQEKVKVNLNELIGWIIDSLAPPENITITIEDELPTIECEETRIIQVFQNLLSNAIKYMDKPQGRIKVGCVEENGFWQFSIADNGPGIEEKYFEKIFGMFQTLSARDEFESTGVGLTLIKKIVEMYGGKIWVQSQPGESSTFYFTLPKQEVTDKNVKLKTTSVC